MLPPGIGDATDEPPPADELAGDDPPDMLGDTSADLAALFTDSGERFLAASTTLAASPRRGGPQPPAHVRNAIITTAEAATTPINVQKGMRAAILIYEKGIPYVWGGHNPNTGLDCSGFSHYVLHAAGREIGWTTFTQMPQGRAVSPAHRQPLDLLFYEFRGGQPNHVIVYMGAGWGIHEPHTGLDAQWVDVNAWKPGAIRRYLPDMSAHPLPNRKQVPAPKKHTPPFKPTTANAAWKKLVGRMAHEWPAIGDSCRAASVRATKTLKS